MATPSRLHQEPFHINLLDIPMIYVASIMNKMTPASFARLKLTCKFVFELTTKMSYTLGVPVEDKKLIIAYDDNNRSRTYKKIVVKIVKSNDDEETTKKRRRSKVDELETTLFKQPVEVDLTFLSGFSFSRVFINSNTVEVDGLQDELNKVGNFLKARKWRSHEAIIDGITPTRFLQLTRPKSASFNILPKLMHPSIKTITLHPHDGSAFTDWETSSCQGVQYVRFVGSLMTDTAVAATFKSLIQTWKKGAHGNVKIIEIDNFREGLEADNYFNDTTLRPLKDVTKVAAKEYVKTKPKYRLVAQERRLGKRKCNTERQQYAAGRVDVALNGRNLVLASHLYSKGKPYGSRYFLSLRAYLDYDGPIPLGLTSAPLEDCLNNMTPEMSLAK